MAKPLVKHEDLDLSQLGKLWRVESEESIKRAMANGAPHGVVTEELMRYLVLKWVGEIDKAKRTTTVRGKKPPISKG